MWIGRAYCELFSGDTGLVKDKKVPIGRPCRRLEKEAVFIEDRKVPIGFEPMNEGFAGLSLTTWVRHRQIGSL